MKKCSGFEWAVLGLAAVVLLVMGVRFLGGQVRTSGVWRVETQRDDSPALSASAEEGWPDSLRKGEIIDLNTAPQADLERLPGIGTVRAQAIVAYRQEHGPFASVEDLLRVDGIGAGVLAQLKPYVTVG